MDDETRALLRDALETYKRYVQVLEARQRDASGWRSTLSYLPWIIVWVVMFFVFYLWLPMGR